MRSDWHAFLLSITDDYECNICGWAKQPAVICSVAACKQARSQKKVYHRCFGYACWLRLSGRHCLWSHRLTIDVESGYSQGLQSRNGRRDLGGKSKDASNVKINDSIPVSSIYNVRIDMNPKYSGSTSHPHPSSPARPSRI